MWREFFRRADIRFCLVAIAVLISVAISIEAWEHQKFMASCLASGRTQFECDVLWRQSQQPPMPIFIR